MRTIVKGTDDNLVLKPKYKTSLDPYDFTGATEITVCFIAEDGTTVEFTKTGLEITIVGLETAGKINVAMNDTKTALIASGDPVDFDLTIDKGTERQTFVVEQSLIIKERNCWNLFWFNLT